MRPRLWPPAGLPRRHWLLGSAALAVSGCLPPGRGGAEPAWAGSWIGDAASAGHRWRDGGLAVPASPAPAERTDVLIVGAGISGLSAARALREAGIESFTLLELHDQPGGNARGHQLAGQACPMGAHYLPVPDASDHELIRWLHEIGLARTELGRTRFAEQHLCHSPQERVFYEGAWHEGLLPPLEPGSAGHAQAQKLAQGIETLRRRGGFKMPSGSVPWSAAHADLDRQTFAQWLQTEGITDPVLHGYLDYACRDDYGAASDTVSAWAGVHYFASRHGFHAPGAVADETGDGVFTWPEGNAWLAQRLAAPLGERVQTGWLAAQVRRGARRRDGGRLVGAGRHAPALAGAAAGVGLALALGCTAAGKGCTAGPSTGCGRCAGEPLAGGQPAPGPTLAGPSRCRPGMGQRGARSREPGLCGCGAPVVGGRAWPAARDHGLPRAAGGQATRSAAARLGKLEPLGGRRSGAAASRPARPRQAGGPDTPRPCDERAHSWPPRRQRSGGPARSAAVSTCAPGAHRHGGLLRL